MATKRANYTMMPIQDPFINNGFEIMRHLHSSTTEDIEVFLVGYQMPEITHVNYTNGIKKRAKEVGNINVVVNSSK